MSGRTGRSNRGTLFAGLLTTLITCAVAPWPARADAALTRQEQQLFNYAFATQFGSGIYDVAGRTAQVYRLPFSWTPRPEGPDQLGVRFRFPVTFGFFDFEPADLLNTGLPSQLDTLSVVPGVEFRLLLRENWTLMPAVEFGVATDRSSEATAWVSSIGIRSVAGFKARGFMLALGNKAIYGRVDPRNDRPADDYFAIETALEARHAMGLSFRGHQTDYGLYVAQYLYFSDPHFPLLSGPTSLDDQYEAGVTFGTVEAVKLWKVALPRLGLGYRFADGASVFRFVIGTPAPALER